MKEAATTQDDHKHDQEGGRGGGGARGGTDWQGGKIVEKKNAQHDPCLITCKAGSTTAKA